MTVPKWASQPGRLLLTPVLGAALGTFISRELPYHVLTIVLIVAVCLLLLAALKSNIAPAISAGVLPLVLGIKSWLYPASIAILAVLVAILLLWRWGYRRKYQGSLSCFDAKTSTMFWKRRPAQRNRSPPSSFS